MAKSTGGSSDKSWSSERGQSWQCTASDKQVLATVMTMGDQDIG